MLAKDAIPAIERLQTDLFFSVSAPETLGQSDHRAQSPRRASVASLARYLDDGNCSDSADLTLSLRALLKVQLKRTATLVTSRTEHIIRHPEWGGLNEVCCDRGCPRELSGT